MRLAQLFSDLPDVPEACVTGAALDSRLVSQGDLFIALAGAANDGHRHIDAAIAAGATAVATERPITDCAIPQVVAANLRRRVSSIAGEVFDHPSASLPCIAVTGTNGKTSVAFFAASLANAIGVNAAFMGTTGWGLVDALATAELTTADPITLQQRFRTLLDAGAGLVALELSSHALAQHRADGLSIDVAVFTNLTQDHLDYHKTMAAYGMAKRRLFDFASLKHVIVNTDGRFGAQLRDDCAKKVALEVVAYSPDNLDVHASAAGLNWTLKTPFGTAHLMAPVFGAHNAGNISAALLALAALGYDFSALTAAVPRLMAPTGRLQLVNSAEPAQPRVFVDYAHTPDALSTVLRAVRPHCSGRLLCVFGCGGDRDPGKRAAMGRAVVALADHAWLTSDNPRTEDPMAIINDVVAGLGSADSVEVTVDRRAAIAAAIAAATPEDLLVIAGKGHETYQEVGVARLPFDDVAIARELLEEASH
jgi:UDP-N-acetylmuramoyl-L-alanyl-D-glutamate--2,6-diaminopimelate ligase